MLGIFILHTFLLSYWLSDEARGIIKKPVNSRRLNFEKRNVMPVLKVDSNGQKPINTSALLRQ